ncbi:MAG: hypothetical protein ACOH5I_04265 [Oligoflexus sp.]
MSEHTLPRRQLIKAGLAGGIGMMVQPTFSWAKPQGNRSGDQPPLLFTFCANGGASIIDAFLPIRRETANSHLNAYEDSMIDSIDASPIRCVKNIPYSIQLPVGPDLTMKNFLQRHYRDMLVLTQQGTSVNHLIAAQRSLNGNGINQGRTLAEAHAVQYGKHFLLPNINMAIAGYVEGGNDNSLPIDARQEVVGDASLFAFSTHGYLGLQEAVDDNVILAARKVRDRLEKNDSSPFWFKDSNTVRTFLQMREQMTELEAANLFELLLLIDRARLGMKSPHRLPENENLTRILEVFPDVFTNPFHAKIALSYLLARYGISGTMTLSMSENILFNDEEPPTRIVNLPLGFDWSHTDHRGAQNAMWRSLLQGIDGLIRLLQSDSGHGRQDGPSLWDRSLVYIATEFGRTRRLENGSGHDLNNGNLLISPLLKGNQVLGGANAENLATYGFDPLTGAPQPQASLDEGDVYSLICQALQIEFPKRRSFPIAVRS